LCKVGPQLHKGFRVTHVRDGPRHVNFDPRIKLNSMFSTNFLSSWEAK
jgi:hypothetical protein